MPKPFQVQDHYFQLAKEQGYRARSAFKLLDIQKKFHLIKRGDTVVDLGAAPGSFLQVISNLVGGAGNAVGFDLQEIEPFKEDNIHTYVQDIMEKDAIFARLEELGVKRADVVTSDLAPKTSGIRDLDQGRSAELTDQAFFLATRILRKGGNFVGKIFEGEEMKILIKRMKTRFRKVSVYKPPSSRDRSFETFVVGMGLL
ncbi:MAG: RlmE family RNA methyltransferase [Candidatus Gracilibacteria bacterium]